MFKLQFVDPLNVGEELADCNDCAVMTVCGTNHPPSQQNHKRFHMKLMTSSTKGAKLSLRLPAVDLRGPRLAAIADQIISLVLPDSESLVLSHYGHVILSLLDRHVSFIRADGPFPAVQRF